MPGVLWGDGGLQSHQMAQAVGCFLPAQVQKANTRVSPNFWPRRTLGDAPSPLGTPSFPICKQEMGDRGRAGVVGDSRNLSCTPAALHRRRP